MKRVLILANNSGGLYDFRLELIQKLVNEKFEVYFAVPQFVEDVKVKLILETGAKYIYTPMNRRGMNPIEDFKLINNYIQVLKETDPDIVLTYTIKPNIYGNYASNKFSKPVIMNITGIGSSLVTGKIKEVVKCMYKYACTKSRYVLFQNEGNLDFFINNKLVHQFKVIRIPGSGVNVEKFKPIKNNTTDGKIRYLFIGRLMKDKGIEEYLTVANKITSKYPNVEFQILGPIEEERYKDIVKNNTNKQIKYLGISNDVRNEIKEVDCIINPSYHEGMSNVLLEGAAMGKSLIASNIPGCKEIIDDGINGYLFEVKSTDDLYDKIVQFIELKEDARITMGINSRNKVVREFDRKIVVNEYMNAINKILMNR